MPGSGTQCTTIEVPLDHDKPLGQQIRLRVGRRKSGAFPTGKAVFNLAGGPGGAATYQSGTIPAYMPAPLLATFDMIYVDQRGTGGSGYLDCSAGHPDTTAEWVACAKEHAAKDLSHYLTLDAARDLERVRERLGYDTIYLRGGSQVTRLGLEYMRQYGDRVAAAVLDGLAPPDWDLLGHGVEALDNAVTKLIKDCDADPTCKAVVPDLKGDLSKRRAQLKQTPHLISVGGQQYQEAESSYRMFLYAMLDYSTLRYKVPRAVHEAVGGDNTRWNQLLSYLVGATVTDARARPPGPPRPAPDNNPTRLLPPRLRQALLADVSYVAPGRFLTVVCSEWMPNTGGVAKLEARAAKLDWVRDGALDLPSACASLASQLKPVAASQRTAVSSTVKTLLLSGEIDVRTPPALGDQAAKTLSSSTHVVIPHASHSTISVACAAKILTDFFLADGDASKLDTSCLKSLPRPTW